MLAETSPPTFSIGVTYWPRRAGFLWWRAFDRGAVREELAAALKKQTAPQLTELLDEYLQGLLARGIQAETVEKISRMLRGFLQQANGI